MPESGKFPPATFPWRCPECDVPTTLARKDVRPRSAGGTMYFVDVKVACGCGHKYPPYSFTPTRDDALRIEKKGRNAKRKRRR